MYHRDVRHNVRDVRNGGKGSTEALAFAEHDLSNCAEDALARAEEIAASAGLKLTPVRRRTLEILLAVHCAMGAHEVLERLASEGFGKQPPVAYRALDFLVDAGLARRIRRLNASTACLHSGEAHQPAFLICRAFDAVAEAAGGICEALDAAGATTGFKVEHANIEAVGLCPACREASK